MWKSVGASGSANNWAFGYYRQGQALGECALELLRREAEECDRMSGLLFLQSLAGGTGSGAGSRITEMVREEYPCCFIFHAAVWPSRRSEVIVQSYNALLSLAHVLESTDAVLALQNDEAHDICQRRLGIARPSLQQLNSVLAASLAELWLPCVPANYNGDSGGRGTSVEMGDVVGSACPSPLHKILSVRSAPHMSQQAIPFSNIAWPGTLTNLRQMVSLHFLHTMSFYLCILTGERAAICMCEESVYACRYSTPVCMHMRKHGRLHVVWLVACGVWTGLACRIACACRTAHSLLDWHGHTIRP